jgi:hypothetical protein
MWEAGEKLPNLAVIGRSATGSMPPSRGALRLRIAFRWLRQHADRHRKLSSLTFRIGPGTTALRHRRAQDPRGGARLCPGRTFKQGIADALAGYIDNEEW